MCYAVLSCSAVSDFCDPMDCSPSGSSVHGILQARILEWVEVPHQGIFPTQGSLMSPVLVAGSLLLVPPGSPCFLVCFTFTLLPDFTLFLILMVTKFGVFSPPCCSVAQLCPALCDCQTSLSLTISRSLLKLTSMESVMPSKHLVLCHPLLLLPSVFPASV